MSNVDDWPYRWFGVWAESGVVYARCPSATQFVMPETNRRYAKERIRSYLLNAPVVVSTNRMSFPNPFTGERVGGSLSYRTDGKWLWLDDLPDYIDHHGVAIPAAFLADIEANNYTPPKSIAPELIESLEWPPVS